jgi:hypothetical protein
MGMDLGYKRRRKIAIRGRDALGCVEGSGGSGVYPTWSRSNSVVFYVVLIIYIRVILRRGVQEGRVGRYPASVSLGLAHLHRQ